MVQWLGLQTPNAEGLGSVPGQGTRSNMLQLTGVHIPQLKIVVERKDQDPTCCI